MPLKFPFAYANVERFGPLFYPIVTIEIKTVFGWKKFDFLVDTGADVTTLPSTILSFLDVNPKSLPKHKTIGVGGISVVTNDTIVLLRIGEKELQVNASITADSATPFLLGRRDIFEEKFSLYINSKLKQTELELN